MTLRASSGPAWLPASLVALGLGLAALPCAGARTPQAEPAPGTQSETQSEGQSEAGAPTEPETRPDEDRYSTVEAFTTPDGELLEIGGMDTASDGRLFVSTRRGQVWIVEDALAPEPSAARFHLFAEGLDEGLGLKILPHRRNAAPAGAGDGEAASGPTDPISGAPITRGVSAHDDIYVVQRGELSRLVDVDGDDTCDVIETVCDDWGLSGNYHEFAFGLPADEQGRLYVTLNVGFLSPQWYHGVSVAPWRGWILRIDPAAPRGQRLHPVACGLRSPCGVGIGPDGDVYVTDNQGDWLASCPLLRIREGAFYNHPASLDWREDFVAAGAKTSRTNPPDVPRDPAVMWMPYKWTRSTGDFSLFPKDSPWGPYEGQLLLAELTNGMLLRAMLEDVQGVRQGAIVVFREQVGSAIRARFARDGSILLGLTNRGWGGLGPDDGIVRVRPTGRLPMEMQSIHLLPDGFEVGFTQPVRDDVVVTPASIALTQYDYDWWWEYGSPERRTTRLAVTAAELSADRRTLRFQAQGLAPGTVARARLSGLVGAQGDALLHDEFAYTVNQLPGAPFSEARVNKRAEPPPPRANGEEGWLRLMWLDATDLWHERGWHLVDAELDPQDHKLFLIKEGAAALVNVPVPGGWSREQASDDVSKLALGDAKVHLEFMLPETGESALWLMGRYGLRLVDDVRAGATGRLFGAIVGTAEDPDIAPEFDAYQGPGRWHDLDVVFEAPRFDAEGKKLSDARIVRALVDDVLLHENVAFRGPSLEAPLGDLAARERAEAERLGHAETALHPFPLGGEVPLGPLVIDGTHGPVAVRNVRVFPQNLPKDDEGFVPLFNGTDLGGWLVARDDVLDPAPLPDGATFTAPDEDAAEDTGWNVEDGTLVGRGPRSHLFSPRGDFTDVSLRARVRISDGGNSGVYLRATAMGGWPPGYEAQVNSSYSDPQKSGSIYGLAPVKTSLVDAGVWFDYEFSAREEEGGTRLVTKVNGLVVSDVLDASRRCPSGHVAFQQHHEGSVVEFRDVRVRTR